MRGRKHEGFRTDLSKLDLQPQIDNPRESPMEAFTVNGESDTVLLRTILVQSSTPILQHEFSRVYIGSKTCKLDCLFS